MRRLPVGGAAFLLSLSRGAALGEAAAAATKETAAFDLTANLVGMIGAGLVVAVTDREGLS